MALAIGGFNIYWYGVIIAAGMLLAMLYAFRNAVDYGIDSDRLVDVVAIGAVIHYVCARIYYVAMAPFEYQSLWEMVDIRKGRHRHLRSGHRCVCVRLAWPPNGLGAAAAVV